MKTEEQYIVSLISEKEALEKDLESAHHEIGALLGKKKALERFIFRTIGLEKLEGHPEYYQVSHIVLHRDDVLKMFEDSRK